MEGLTIEAINQNEVRVTGLSRSGNHAIINWIREQVEGRTCFLNCAEGKSNPFESARPLDDGSVFQANYEGFDLEAEKQGQFSTKDWLIFSHEDSFLGHACSDVFESHHDQWIGPSNKRFDVLILRDPYNLMASRWRTSSRLEEFTPPNSDKVTLRIWKQHARQFLGRTDALVGTPVTISYNRWCHDRDYRRKLALRLGVKFSDRGKDRVSTCAGGSSFDGLAFDGSAERMRVGERWRRYADDAEFWALFDEQTHQLAHELFGRIAPVEQLGACKTVA